MQSLSNIIERIKEAEEIASKTPNEPEAKLRELVSPIWIQFLKEKKIGLNLQIRDELTLANGRADTVFNKLILEYKKPQTIKPNNDKNRKLISQVQGYILDLAKKERFGKERLLGVAFDGNYFLFMRYTKRWIQDEPVPLNEKSLELFLKNLEKLTSKAALIPENLIRDFAVGKESRNKVAVDCIKAFYSEINQYGGKGDTKEHVFFKQWQTQFAEVHGTLEQKKIDHKTLFTSYGFNKKEQKDFNALAFFFSLDSYYALLIKLLSYQVVGFYTLKDLTGLPLHDWENCSSENLRQKCEKLEEGGVFRNLGIRNFLEGDLFSWYTQAWNDEIYKAVKQIISHLNDYDPETMEIAPDETRDILKKLYQYLVPKQIRHDLGEYYTPDWLAERCLNQVGYGPKRKDLMSLRILDPGCGSGTFLILAIKRAKEFAKRRNIDGWETLKKIVFNIQGFDLNPLAVISARTNYMLAIADLLKYRQDEITIPIYLCDSINPPQARIANEMTLFEKREPYEVRTAVGNFLFPHSIINKRSIQRLANIMEDCVENVKSNESFLAEVAAKLDLTKEEFQESELYLDDTYEKLIRLNQRGINGIWARIIKNAFAPLFVGKFDIVVGNPPWVTWGSLPKDYRIGTQRLWTNYNLFEHKGLEARLGKSGDDISVLMTYVSLDRYLNNNGSLCFVITQSLFQSVGGGKGFRRFELGKNGTPFKVIQVDDMVLLQPFEGATNRTAIFNCKKGEKTVYPIQYCIWKKKHKGSIDIGSSLKEVIANTKRIFLDGQPISDGKQGPWIKARPRAFSAAKKMIGESYYRARLGVHTGGANGLYWINIIDQKDNGESLLIENNYNIGKIAFKPVREIIESKLVYPLLRGKEVHKWSYNPSLYIVLAQNKKIGNKAIPESTLIDEYPKTYNYLHMFKEELLNRSHYKKHFENQGAPFYSTYNIGLYTFSRYKVVWKEQSKEFQCAVVSKEKIEDEEKVIIPDHKLMLVPFDEGLEAHFVAACLNSALSRFIVMSYTVSTQQNTHILKNIAIPQFDQSNSIHQNLSLLSQQCHEKRAAGIDVTDLEEQIDELTAEMWGLTKEELNDIQNALEELR